MKRGAAVQGKASQWQHSSRQWARCTQCACSHSGFSTPYPPAGCAGGLAVLMTEYDDAKQASGQCARACGALTRVRSACLWRAQRACATPLPQGGAKTRSSARGQRDGAVCLTNSAASAFVVAVVICPSPCSLVAVADRSLPAPFQKRSGVCCFALLLN